MKLKRIWLIVFLISSLILLTGCGNNNSTEDLKSKATEEVNYLDNKIISISSLINGINLQNYKVETKEISMPDSESQESSQSSSQSSEELSSSGQSSGGSQSQSSSSGGGSSSQQENTIQISEMKTTSILASSQEKIDWNKIKTEIELLYSTWDTIILDLYKLNIPAEIINDFSTTLNEVTLNIKKEDKNESLSSLSKLYSYLPKYLEYCSDSKESINIKNTKHHIITAFALVEKEMWEDITSEVNSAINSYIPIINNIEFTKGKEHSMNRIYIILNELKNSLKYKDKDIFYINYKNLINELSLL